MYYYSIFYPAGESGHEENTGNLERKRHYDRLHRRKIKRELYEQKTPEPGQMGVPVLPVLPDAD